MTLTLAVSKTLQNWSRVRGPSALPDDGALRLWLLADLAPDVRLRREALQQRLPDAQEELRKNGSLVIYQRSGVAIWEFISRSQSISLNVRLVA